MTFLLALALWVVTSLLLALTWVAYRGFIAKYSLEQFDGQVMRTYSESVQR